MIVVIDYGLGNLGSILNMLKKIQAEAIISKNVSIGKNCVVGANAFVNKNIPPNSIVFGTPGKIVGKVVVDSKNKIKFKLC